MDTVTDKSRWSVHGRSPARVVEPRDEAEAMACLADQPGAVVPWGSGRRLDLGDELDAYDTALVLAHLDQVWEFDPADLVVTVGAGLACGDLSARLAAAHQCWPVDAPPGASVGGVVAENLAGLRRGSSGAPRDWVCGLHWLDAAGIPHRSGGRVVKNVAGYDTIRPLVGSLGTLGVITRVTLKVWPQPQSRVAAILPVTDPAAGASLAGALAAGRAVPTALALADAAWAGTDTPQVVVGYEGTEAVLATALAALPRPPGTVLTDSAADDLWRSPVAPPAHWPLYLRVACLPRTAGAVLALGAELPGVRAAGLADLWAGGAWLGLAGEPADLAEAVRRVRSLVAETAGAVILERAPLFVRRQVGTFGDLGPARPLMRALKQRWDPTGRLAPGRLPL